MVFRTLHLLSHHAPFVTISPSGPSRHHRRKIKIKKKNPEKARKRGRDSISPISVQSGSLVRQMPGQGVVQDFLADVEIRVPQLIMHRFEIPNVALVGRQFQNTDSPDDSSRMASALSSRASSMASRSPRCRNSTPGAALVGTWMDNHAGACAIQFRTISGVPLLDISSATDDGITTEWNNSVRRSSRLSLMRMLMGLASETTSMCDQSLPKSSSMLARSCSREASV